LPLNVLIVDDEELARDEMRYLLEQIGEIQIVGEAEGGEEAVALAVELSPDIIFLDIQMPVLDGFGVVSRLVESGNVPLIIFTTAYDQYAIKAFEINAIDYLLKPIERERLEEAIERAQTVMPMRGEFVEKLKHLTEGIRVGRKFLPKIVVRKDDGIDLIDTGMVAMLEKRGREVIAHTDNGDHVTNYVDLDELEVQLDPTIFLRLGSIGIVNLEKIGEIVPWSGGNYVMTLEDSSSTEIRLTRTQAQLIKNKAEGR
jgi:two-component system LytT family response regulator/two-component system response regulator LytT